MRIRLLALHRKESYSGEYAPEIVDVVDEVTLEDNPSWWTDQIRKQKELIGDEAGAWAEIEVDISTEAIMKALYPPKITVTGTVV